MTKTATTFERLERHRRFYTPRRRLRTLQWCRRHARNTDGRPYSHDAYPHLGAPGGPADAIDDPKIRKIWLQFASRLGKTFFGQCCVMKKADEQPGPMMFASSVEKTAIEVTERTYAMLEQSPRVSGQLRPPDRRRQSCIDFSACQCHVAWSRSVSTLADKEVECGHANEVDKWEHTTTSKEADPLRLFMDRFKNLPHHKVIIESTPTVRGNSRIESGRLASTNCQFYVPCPLCNRYQTLKLRSGPESNERYHLRWERPPGGKQDKDLARRTAWYECEHCNGRIEDHHRPWMMRLGVWCPEGCTVKDVEARAAAESYLEAVRPKGGDGASTPLPEWQGWGSAPWIEGVPFRDGPDAGYQLSSLYAISLTWGDIAAEFVTCKDKPQDLRNFMNGWLAESWEHLRRKVSWEKLGGRIIDRQAPRGRVPLWASILTAGIDRQSSGGTRFPWVVDAWGPEGRNATIAYGECESFDDLLEAVILPEWAHEDGGHPLQVEFALIDSGYRPSGVYEFCGRCHAAGLNVWPSKGSSTVLESEYRVAILGDNTSCPGMRLVHVDTVRSQLWMEAQLENSDGKYSLFAGDLLMHQDFLEQLLNDAAVEELDRTNNLRESWMRISDKIPNDFRDGRRYSYIAYLITTHGRGAPKRQPAPPVQYTTDDFTPAEGGGGRNRW